MKKTICIKVGTSSLLKHNHPNLSIISSLVEQIHSLKNHYNIVLISSGAIGFGSTSHNNKSKPETLSQKQAFASIGQLKLLALYSSLFSVYDITISQVLLTRSDVNDKERFENAKSCFKELLEMNVVPIVNENDTVSVDEIKFGDNDTLSAITSGIVQAKMLIILTDVDCLYDCNPLKPNAKPIYYVDDIDALEADVCSKGELGTGGMETKVIAAELASFCGIDTVIASSENIMRISEIIERVEHKERADDGLKFTHFVATVPGIKDNKKWYIMVLGAKGSITLNKDGYEMVVGGKDLLLNGIESFEGNFKRQDSVKILYAGKEIGRGLTKVDSENVESSQVIIKYSDLCLFTKK